MVGKRWKENYGIKPSKECEKNVASGAINKIVSLLAPFVARTIFLRIMSSEYIGLNGLFSSILSVLSVAELGFDAAITYNLYKPVANGDIETADALLNLYKRYITLLELLFLHSVSAVFPF